MYFQGSTKVWFISMRSYAFLLRYWHEKDCLLLKLVLPASLGTSLSPSGPRHPLVPGTHRTPHAEGRALAARVGIHPSAGQVRADLSSLETSVFSRGFLSGSAGLVSISDSFPAHSVISRDLRNPVYSAVQCGWW